MLKALEEQASGFLSHLKGGMSDRGQGRLNDRGMEFTGEPHQGYVGGNGESELFDFPHGGKNNCIIDPENGIG